jgi:hypothetical protein
MKELNWKPEIEIVRFGTADIVTTSAISGGNDDWEGPLAP